MGGQVNSNITINYEKMSFSSSVPTVSNEILNMFNNDEATTNSAYDDFIEVDYENIEYIEEEFEEPHNEVPASEDIVVENMCKYEVFEEYASGHNGVVTCEQMALENIAKAEVVDCQELIDFVEMDDIVYKETNDLDETADESLDILEEFAPVPFSIGKRSLKRKKRKKHPELWKSNIRRKKRESGQEYTDTNNKKIPARTMKPPCHGCCFKCAEMFTLEERLHIFNSFWSLTDKQKSSFYFQFVIREPAKRHRTCSEEIIKQFSYKYYFEKDQSIHRVCREFFLNTLSIDQKRIYYCFQHFKMKSSPQIKANIGKFEEVDELALVPDEDVVSDKDVVSDEAMEQLMASEVTEDVSTVKLEVMDVPSSTNPISLSTENESLLTKKRKRNPDLWKANIRKKQRESGQEYTGWNNQKMPARSVKPPCKECFYNCANMFTAEERLAIFKAFWSLKDSEKTNFYLKYVIRVGVKRHRKKYAEEPLKKFTYQYYFKNNESIRRVCRIFFLNTLCIDQRRIYYCFQNFENRAISPIEENIGKFEEVVHEENGFCNEAMVCNETLEEKNVKLEEIPKTYSQNPIEFSLETEKLLAKKQKKLKKANKRKGQKVSIPKHATIKPPCENCIFNCARNFTENERLHIFKTFWSLTNNEKKDFYFKFVIRDRVKRRRKYRDEIIKKFTFKYYFENNQSIHRVCRVFFLNTLCIDQRRIYYCFQNLQNKYSFPVLDNIVKFEVEHECDEVEDENDELVAGKEAMVCEAVMACEETVDDIVKSHDEVVVPAPIYPVYITEDNKPPRKKRTRNPDLWKENIRKKLRKSGQQYISINKKEVPAKAMKPPCNNCMFNCVNVFNAEERLNIFKTFWNLTDNEKRDFYLKYVIRGKVKRRRKKTLGNIKKYSFKYYLEKNQTIYRVCRIFFLNTLAIDQKRIYYCFQKSVSAKQDKIVKLEKVDEFDTDCEKLSEDGNNNLEEFILPCPDNVVGLTSGNGSLLTKSQKKTSKLKKSITRKRQQKLKVKIEK